MKEFVCIECGEQHVKTGRNQKRCPSCAKVAQLRQIKEHAIRTGKYTGTGSGAHNTPREKHPQWKGGESLFINVLAPEYYQRVRYCERCGFDLKDAPPAKRCVHHKDHNRKNNVEENFELLCKRCHQIEHECWKNLPQFADG